MKVLMLLSLFVFLPQSIATKKALALSNLQIEPRRQFWMEGISQTPNCFRIRQLKVASMAFSKHIKKKRQSERN